MTSITDLRKICDAATQPPYHVTHLNENEPRFDVENGEGIRVCDEIQQCDFDFLSYFSPTQVRKLLEVIELQQKALEDCATTIDDDSVKTTTDDDEEEYWVSHSQITCIVDEALAKSKELLG